VSDILEGGQVIIPSQREKKIMPDHTIATQEDFRRVTEDLDRRLYPPRSQVGANAPKEKPVALATTPPPQIDDSVELADSNPIPDFVYGLPEVKKPEDDFEPKYIPPVEQFPAYSLDPDIVPTFIETSMGKLMLGPVKDAEEAAEELAASYGG
jgi:hypothetical protein